MGRGRQKQSAASRANQLERENSKLRAEIRRLSDVLEHRFDKVVQELIVALDLAAAHGAAAPSSTPTDSDGPRGKPGSRPPTGGNPRARAAGKRLRHQVGRAVDDFNARVENDWQRPDYDRDRSEDAWPKSVPTVRCSARNCRLRNKRVPAYRIVEADQPPIVRWECECGRPYPSHPLDRKQR